MYVLQPLHTLTLLLCSQVEKSAFVVGDLGALMRQHVCWQSTVPQLQPYFPVRCNSSPAVIEVLASLGLGFVCTNKVSFHIKRYKFAHSFYLFLNYMMLHPLMKALNI